MSFKKYTSVELKRVRKQDMEMLEFIEKEELIPFKFVPMLEPDERERAQDILIFMRRRQDLALSEPQRRMIRAFVYKIDPSYEFNTTPRVTTADVPRGRDVQPAEVLKKLPLRPPGQPPLFKELEADGTGRKHCDECGGCTGVHVAGCSKMDSHVHWVKQK